MRIAIPTSDGQLDVHFGHCNQFTIIDANSGSVQRILTVDAPPHQSGQLPSWVAEKHITDVLSGGMGKKAMQLFDKLGINVFVGAPKLSPDELVKRFLENSIEFSSNYCVCNAHIS